MRQAHLCLAPAPVPPPSATCAGYKSMEERLPEPRIPASGEEGPLVGIEGFAMETVPTRSIQLFEQTHPDFTPGALSLEQMRYVLAPLRSLALRDAHERSQLAIGERLLG